MGLIDLKTDLKSLRYGKDRIGGGSSNQPYIKSKIPTNEGDLGSTGGPDFLLRGGLLTPGRILKDTSRLTQMFFDFKSPNGLLFTAKQNVLSLTNVNSSRGYKEWAVTNTDTTGKSSIGKFISQAGDFIENNIAINQGIYTPLSTIGQSAGNALGIHLNKQGLNPLAGASSTTGISIGSNITGYDPLGLPTYLSNTKGEGNEGPKSRFYDFLNKINKKSTDTVLYKYTGGPGATLGIGTTTIRLSKDRTGINNEVSKELIKRSNTFVLSGEQISNKVPSKFNPQVKENFIKSTGNPNQYSRLKYSGPGAKNIEKRINLGNPGKKQKDERVALDKVTHRQIYSTTSNNPNVPETNDLVKFRIGVIDNKNPSKKTNIHFRAFIDSMSDSYSADWQTQKFMGRGENFYRYNGFDRNVSLSWTVVAQSKAELIPMYKKLNYLASVCTPDYSDLGYMRGNLIKLTIGGYLYEQVGIMKSITYDIPQESPWEIAIPYGSEEGGTPLGVSSDSTVKELPHMIKVTGFQFIPIHDFVPSVQKNDFEDGELISYGDEKYIALSNGINNNYDRDIARTTTLQQQPIQPLNLTNNLSTDIII